MLIEWSDAAYEAKAQGFAFCFLGEPVDDPRAFFDQLGEVRQWCYDEFGDAPKLDTSHTNQNANDNTRIKPSPHRWTWSRYYYYFNNYEDAFHFKMRWWGI